MPGCAAPNCSNRSDHYQLFSFPRDPNRRLQWAINCRRLDWYPSDTDRICEVHFEPSQFLFTPQGKRRLIGTAVPTLITVSNCPQLIGHQRKSLHRKNKR